MSKPIFVGDNSSPPGRVQRAQKSEQALKNIIDPFLQWYNELFNSQDDYPKKLGDTGAHAEESPVSDNGFEVNEETLFNILSADLQGPPKTQSFHTFRTLPTIPPSIAERTNLSQKTYSHKLEEFCKERNDKRRTVNRIKYANRAENIDMDAYLTSTDFIDTRNLCESLKDLTIMKHFLNNSEE